MVRASYDRGAPSLKPRCVQPLQSRASSRGPRYAAKLGDFSKGSWASYDPAQHEAAAKSKFIVSSEADRDQMFQRIVQYATRGDVSHDQRMSGKPAGRLLTRRDGDMLRQALEQLCYGDALTGELAHIRERLMEYAARVHAAAEEMPTPALAS